MLLTEIDVLGSRIGIYVIAATNRPDIIDPVILPPGRLETLLFVDLPSEDGCLEISYIFIRNCKISFIEDIADRPRGYGGLRVTDLEALPRAGYAAIKRANNIKLKEFSSAKNAVRPSMGSASKHEGLKSLWEADL